MALTKITKSGLTADVVDETKIADNAISEEHLDTTAILGNTELSEVAASNDIFLVYDASSGTLKKILSSNVGITPPTFSSVSPTNVVTGDGTGNATFTITGTNFDASATAKLKTTAGVEVNFDSVTRDSATQITAVIAISSLSNANEPYDVVIVNGTGLQVTGADQISLDAQPVYVTAAGSLGDNVKDVAGSFSVNATDPESAGNVTFELQSGSLPPGYTLTNTAAEGGTAIISGTDTTTSSTTIYNFVLRAVDAASNTSSRAFSIRTRIPVSESFTSDGTFSVPSGITSVDVLIVAGGGGGANRGPAQTATGGGGGGGLIFMPGYPVTPEGTITVTVGAGGVSPAANGCGGVRGQDSVFGAPTDGFLVGGVLTAKAGGGGGGFYIKGPASYDGWGQPGGSGGGGGTGASSGPGSVSPTPTTPGGTGDQPTQPGNSGAYGFGSNGGFGARQDVIRVSGGGGGAGAAGSPYCAAPTSQSAGGIGKAYTIADGTTPVYYSGGGGGGGIATGLQGGQGGGGNGQNTGAGQDGQANKGGGAGGGGTCGTSSQTGANGGKGVVIVRY